MLHLNGLRAIARLLFIVTLIDVSIALVKQSSQHQSLSEELSRRRPRYFRSLSDENTCYILGLHATCTGTTSNQRSNQRTLAELLSSSRLSTYIEFLTISQNVDLSSRNLHVLERLTELNISNNAVAAATLDENFLAHFPRLTTLKIVKSGLVTLPVFRDRHPSLSTLVLNHNSIQSWTEASLLALPNLRSLHLARNNISELRAEMFPRDCQLTDLEADVACIDVNMGCPKDYSTKGGMGAALISDVPRAVAILKALVAGLSVPVTCKIRILPSVPDTVALAQSLESTGIACLAVHGRFKQERPHHPNHNDYIAAVCRAVSLPVLANGGSEDAVRLPLDVEYFRRVTGAAGVMLARAAMHNPSIFRRQLEDRLEPSETVVVKYLKYAITYDNPFPQSKYCIQQLLHDRTESDVYRATLAGQTWSDLCSLWDISAWYGEHLAKMERLEADAEQAKALASQQQQEQQESEQQHLAVKRKLDTAAETALSASGPLTKRRLTVDSDTGEVLASFRYLRRLYRPETSPKMLLHTHCQWRDLAPPEYKTDYIDRLYYSQVTVEGKVYRNLLGDQSKRYAEQGAACICLVHLGLPDGRKDEERHQQEKKSQPPAVKNGEQQPEVAS